MFGALKAIKYFRFELFLQEIPGDNFKQITVFLAQSKKNNTTEL
jgi:hypothetical protein